MDGENTSFKTLVLAMQFSKAASRFIQNSRLRYFRTSGSKARPVATEARSAKLPEEKRNRFLKTEQ